MGALQKISLRVLVLVLFLKLSCLAHADPKEISSFSELTASHKPGTLYVLDLDNTVFRPKGFFGSDHWYKELVERVKKRGLEYSEWKSLLYSVVAAVYGDLQIQLVDPAFQEFYERIGPRSILGLTARSKVFLRKLTFDQLQSLQLKFQPEDFLPNFHTIENEAGSFLAAESGVIMVGGLNKGTVLRDYIKQYGANIERVVFVDDLAAHAQNVSDATRDLGIPVESYRLTAADQYHEEYNAHYRGSWSLEDFVREYFYKKHKKIAEQYPKELEKLKKIIPDSTSKSLKKSKLSTCKKRLK